MKPRSRSAAFTLLELLVVLAILATVTALAVRSLDRVDEQRRYETALRCLQEINDAVLGSPDDRAPDGTRTVSGFVADMGRLPRALLAASTPELELRELWESPGAAFDIRSAIEANGVVLADEDPQVLVPGGWRGPYLRLPLGTPTLLDGWGNPISSPTDASPPNPESTGYARLRNVTDNPITATGQDVRVVRLLGANGQRNSADAAYDRDEAVTFTDDKFRASLAGNIEVLNGSSPAPADNTKAVTIRVFGPDGANASEISVVRTTVPFTSNPVTFSIPLASGVTIGPRIVRAYLHPAGTPATSATEKRSAVKHVTLRGGANLLDLAIDR
jgi:prepilin-type N-terminal cleavage/methylation domain-containing protein